MVIKDLRHPIQILSATRTAGASQTMTTTFALVATVWAHIKIVKISAHMESMVADPGNLVTHIFTIRYRSDVDSKSFIWANGSHYEIKRLASLEERDIFLEVHASKREEASAS